jgi:hypothetical protein
MNLRRSRSRAPTGPARRADATTTRPAGTDRRRRPAGRRHDRTPPARHPPTTPTARQRHPTPGVSLYHRPTLKELQARTTLNSPSPRLRGLAAIQQATTATGRPAAAELPCIGDGTLGNRIQMIYARSPLVPDRYASLLPSFRQWAAEFDQATWLSAAETGGGRHLRFVTDADCQLDVARALLTPAGEASFDLMRTELQVLGHNRTDRKYLVWVDAATGICGLGEVYDDQRPTASNWNNTGPMYARVDAPCWRYAELHEIFHTLGAVQPDTPTTAPPATAPTKPTSCATTTTPAAPSP